MLIVAFCSSVLFDASVPPNGLVVYCGTVVTSEGKEKKVNFDFEPFKPINTSLYLCDNKFHTEVCACTFYSSSKVRACVYKEELFVLCE